MCPPTRGPANGGRGSAGNANAGNTNTGGGHNSPHVSRHRQAAGLGGPPSHIFGKLSTSYADDEERESLMGNSNSSNPYHNRANKVHGNHHAVSGRWTPSWWRNVLAIGLMAAVCFMVGEAYGERQASRRNGSSSENLRHTGVVQKFSGEPKNQFIIISQQRSGSRFLTSLLDGHKNIRCGNEELLQWTKDHGGDPENAANGKDLTGSTVQDYAAEMEAIMHRLPKDPTDGSPEGSLTTHVGFKIMYDQGILHFGEELLQHLEDNNIKIIHLVRKNKLLQYVSKDSNNKDKGVDGHNAHPTTEEEAAQLRDVTVDGKVKKIIKFLREKAGETKAATDLLDAHFGSEGYLTIYYEDLDDDNQREMDRIFDYIDVESIKVQSEYTKIHEGKRTREYFAEEDRAEVEAAIRNSRFADMLEPNLPGYLGW
jgi:LPS sulfotransferase NodH